MAHELDFSQATGVANTFSVIETPWHREGHVLLQAPTYEEAMRVAEIDYPVVKLPTVVTLPTADGQDTYQRTNKSAFITLREDRQVELGAVGPGYTVLQNADAFRAIVPLLDSGLLALETGGVLRAGADAWLMGRFDLERFGPDAREVLGDEVVPYALFTNNHTGRRNATVAATPVRVVCANTLGWAETEMDQSGRMVGVRHTGEAAVRMAEAAEQLFAGIVQRYEVIARHYRALKATLVQEAEARAMVEAIIEDPRKGARWNPDAPQAGVVIERFTRRQTEILRLWTEGKGHTGDHSAWELYNGAVEAIDHNEDLFPVRGGVYRTASLMDGALRDKKAAALKFVTRLATAAGNLQEA